MVRKIPAGIRRQHIFNALADLRRGTSHSFGESTGYDVLYKGERYPPKAVIGLAASKLAGAPFGPYDFKGGIGSKCFQILEANGFIIVTKPETNPFPDEVDAAEGHTEGSVEQVLANRYERDSSARASAIKHHGLRCQVCDFDFEAAYGAIGQGFIHVHHIVPLSQIRKSYVLDPIRDLRTVCPNCHAMLHRRIPPYTVDELRAIANATRSSVKK